MKPDITVATNLVFKTDQKKLYEELVDKKRQNRKHQMHRKPESSGATCGTNLFKHNHNAEWLAEQRTRAENVSQRLDICITKDAEQQQLLKRMANWKAPG